MLQGVEYIPFDFNDPKEGRDQLLVALRALVHERAAKDQRDSAILVLACVALVLLAAQAEAG